MTKSSNIMAVIVAQLVELSHPIPEIRGSNQIILFTINSIKSALKDDIKEYKSLGIAQSNSHLIKIAQICVYKLRLPSLKLFGKHL